METDIDRISELPDALILHILSFLPTDTVLETCTLSKRWRYLWLSVPTLKIADSYFSGGDDDFVSLNRFTNFVDRFLLMRDTTSDIQTFKLECHNINIFLNRLKLEYDVSSRIATWIMAAVKHNVQELKLLISTNQMIKLPNSFFTCKSLKKFKFSGFGRDLTDFVLPNITMCFPRLRYLALRGVSVIGDENLTSKLFSSCPVLESLLLTDCSIKFDFTSLSLKHFELDNCDTYDSIDDCVNTVKLSAPNLTSLVCKDYMSQDYSLEYLSSLVTANIGMRVENADEGCTPEPLEAYSELATKVKKLYGARLIKFLRAVHNVTDLTLSTSPGFLEVLSGSLDLLDDFQFCNLRSLKVLTWVSRNCMKTIAYLVKISPRIEHIFLTVEKTKLSTKSRGDWIVGSSFPCLPFLKSVEIRGIHGSLNELKLLQVLLKNATVLEKVTLFSRKSDSSVRAAQLMDIKEKLLAFPTASSSVSISIQS